MCEKMVSRGPDAVGYWHSDDGYVTLGHRRLSIVDLDARANQPMVSPSGRCVAVFNGEIYNFREIRTELEVEGRIFRTSSDTEVILALYERDRERMLTKLRGMFAIAIWDIASRTLFLARDPYGIKPLYIGRSERGWLFASQVKAILATGQVSREADLRGQAGFWMLGSVPEPHTWFRDIKALPAGTWATIDSEGKYSGPRQYWDVADSWRQASESSLPADVVQADVRRLLLESVRYHLVADVPVGVFLSGGIDSGALAGLMIDAGARDLEGVTIAYDEFSGSDQDEAPVAAQIAGHYGIRHFVRRVRKSEFLADLPRILDSMDQPSIDGINTWYASKAVAERGLKVVVSGVGGDELFLGYESFVQLPRLVRAWRPMSSIPGAMAVANIVAGARAGRTGNSRWKYAPKWARSMAGAWWLRRSVCSPEELPIVMGREQAEAALAGGFSPDAWVKDMTGGCAALPELDLARIESMSYLRNQLLRDSDWASMAHSVELRTPLVDAHLLRGLQPYLHSFMKFPKKTLLARAPGTSLPEDVIGRRKTGFGIPVGQWLDGNGGGMKKPIRQSWMLEVAEYYEKMPLV